MVFVKFTKEDGGNYYFVGQSLEAVLDDTHGGKEFGGIKITSYCTVTRAEVEATGASFLEEGIAAVEGGIESYKLGPTP